MRYLIKAGQQRKSRRTLGVMSLQNPESHEYREPYLQRTLYLESPYDEEG